MRQMITEIQYTKTQGMQQKREVRRKTCLHQETGKLQNNQPNITPQGDRKRTTNKAQSFQKKENNKDQSINKIESKIQERQ